MMRVLLAILAASLLGCTGPRDSAPLSRDVFVDAGADATRATTILPASNIIPIPTPTGDAGALCNVPPGQLPYWGNCTGVGVAGTVLPDAGVGGIWYQGDAGVPDPVGLSACATGQTIDWSGGVPVCVSIAGDVTGAVGTTTVGKIQGNTVTGGALTRGQFFVASTTSNWAATTLSGDVSESATTAGQVTVTGAQGAALPSLPGSAQCLEYTGSAWAFTSCGAGAVTWANDLSGNGTTTSSNQYVSSLSYSSNAAGGTIQINGTGTSFGFANNNGGPLIDQLAMASTSSGNGSAGATFEEGAQAGQAATGATHNGGNGGEYLTFSGAGGTSGSASPGSAGLWVAKVGGTGGTTFASFGGTTADFLCFDGVGCGGSGYIRVPNSTQTIISAAGPANILATDGSNNVQLNAPGSDVFLGVAGTTYEQLTSSSALFGASSSYTIGFPSTVTSGAIQWFASSSGVGAPLTISAQSGGGSGNGGGDLSICTGAPTTTGNPGNLNLQIANVSTGSTHAVLRMQEGSNNTFLAFSDAAYSASYGGAAGAAGTTPNSSTIYVQGPNGSCNATGPCTPGSLIINTAAAGATGSPTEGYLGVERAGSLQFAAGAITGLAGTYAGAWLGPGIAPSASNWILAESSSAAYLNAPSGGTLYFEIGSNQEFGITATGASLYLAGAGSLGLYNWVPSSGTRNTQTGTETRSTYYLRTSATTTATMATIAVPASQGIIIHGKIIGRLAAAAFTALACETVGTFSNNGGTVTQTGSTAAVVAQGLTCAMSISGANVNVTVFGQTSATTDFQAVVDVTDN